VQIKPQNIIFYKYGAVFSKINEQLKSEINLPPECYSLLGGKVVGFVDVLFANYSAKNFHPPASINEGH
jgi:hypothetical protein